MTPGVSKSLTRSAAAFGSARNPADSSITIPDDEYLDLPFRLIADESGERTDNPLISLEEIVEALASHRILVLVGTFGAGKSLTVRELFRRLAARYTREANAPAPIAISLRDHWGAKYADEILERHAREIGFTPREDLLVAWRAGLATLLLDGFDELATQAVVSSVNRSFMREARFQALSAVRNLIANVPSSAGCMITGRNHYFDNYREMIRALGIGQRSSLVIEIQEFSESQAEIYVTKKVGMTGVLPDWLPRKPLMLAYLTQKGLLQAVLAIESNRGFSHAWNRFLELICEREAAYGTSVMEPDTLRRVLERLAWDVRSTASGTGPITERELSEAYLAETGQNAGEGVLMQLQRLPGVTPREQDSTSRAFVDADMLSALQGGALSKFLLEARSPGSGRESLDALSKRATEMASYLIQLHDADVTMAVAAALRLQEGRVPGSTQLAADCIAVALTGSEDDAIDCLGATIERAVFRTLAVEDKPVNRLNLRDCWIEEIQAGPPLRESKLVLVNCSIGKVYGVSDQGSLPKEVFQNCNVDQFDSLSTNASIVSSDLPPKMKALLTTLRKLYMQAGGGRQVAALRRGLPPGPISDSVDEVVRILESHKLVLVFNDIAHPVRRLTSRVQAILQARALSQDPVVQQIMRT